jgi:phosphatidylglycerophosphatase A
MKKLLVFAATGFGLGYSPFVPGTVGTLPGIALALLMGDSREWLPWRAAVAFILVLAAIPMCHVAGAHFGTKDDRRIVADEYLTFPLTVLGLPWTTQPWLLLVAFVNHRVCDIVKPPPARQAEALPGGWGIVADDALSGVYALLMNHAIYRIYFAG